jgi:hypothetical protein
MLTSSSAGTSESSRKRYLVDMVHDPEANSIGNPVQMDVEDLCNKIPEINIQEQKHTDRPRSNISLFFVSQTRNQRNDKTTS